MSDTADATRILIVDDEPAICEMIAFALAGAGFATRSVADARAASEAIREWRPHLVVLDWMLPGVSGVELARRLRRQAGGTATLPIIMLTARGAEADRLQGFAAGADDYVVKPFSTAELVARIRALLRRSGAGATTATAIGGVEVDPQAHRVHVDGRPVALSPTEFRLLSFLARHPERVFTRAQLLDHVWGDDVAIEERTVDVHVRRLRKALEPHGRAGLVQTVRGVGYRLSATGGSHAEGL